MAQLPEPPLSSPAWMTIDEAVQHRKLHVGPLASHDVQRDAAVRRLPLKVSDVSHVYFCSPTGETIYVQDPIDLTPEEREDVIERLILKVRGF